MKTEEQRIESIRNTNKLHGTDFRLGQVISYDAGKGRGQRSATITDGEDGFLKIMRDGDDYEYPALWEPSDLFTETPTARDDE